MFDLYLGNKNYSSWSLRPWLLMKHFGIPFNEHMESVDGRDNNPHLRVISDNGRVPCLHVDGFQIWESIAIAEYLAEREPRMWPTDPLARARARSISAEMHAGFAALRTAMPMNLKFKLKGKSAEGELRRDIERVIAIWEDARKHFAGDGGPYLFGAFSVADAMFAPVVWRFHIYNVPLPPVAAAYRDTLLAHPAMVEWYDAALKETEAHSHYDCVANEYGGSR
jgi:glutathione S-transferase